MIYVGFGYSPGSFVSRAIAWFTKANISHTFFLLKDPVFGWVVLGSEARGFYPMAASGWSPSYVVDLFAVPGLEKALYDHREALGAPYDYSGLIGMTWVEAMKHWFKRQVRNPLTKVGAWFCSAVVAEVLEADGVDCPGEPREVDPGTVRDTLAAKGFARAKFAEVIAS